ncbi:MAG: TonB-dependent receptor [Saprospiraceae bacterium]|nr:TonB-dependent receptor [Saprospiraceae bacterium]
MTAKLIFPLLLIFAAQVAISQNIDLFGRVLDKETRQPIGFATVGVFSRDTMPLGGVTTDENGAFNLKATVSATNTLIKVQFLGYETAWIVPDLSFSPGRTSFALPDIFLIASAQWLREVQVNAEKNAASMLLDKKVLNAEKFQTAANGTALDLLQKMPAVSLNTEGNIALRGDENILVLVNGKPSNRKASDILAQIPANQIEQVEISTNPSAQYDSEGKAGVINIILKKNAQIGWNLTANAMFGGADPARYGGDLSAAYNGGKWSAFVSADARQFNMDGYRGGQIRILKDDTLSSLPSQGIRPLRDEQYSFRAGGSFAPTDKQVFNFGYYRGYKQSDRTANIHYQDYIKTGNGLNLFDPDLGLPVRRFYNENLFVRSGEFSSASVDYTHTMRGKQKLTILGFYEHSVLGGPLRNREEEAITGEPILVERTEESSPLDGWRWQADYVLPLASGQKLEMGYQWRGLRHRGDFVYERLNLVTDMYEKTQNYNNQLDLQQQVNAAYAQLSGEKQGFSWNAGLRTEYTDRTLSHTLETSNYRYKQWHLFPTAQALWLFDKKQKLRAGFSRRIDRPTNRYLAPVRNHRHAEVEEIGNPELLPEIGNLAEVAYDKNWSRFSLNVTGYFNYVQNKIFKINRPYSRTTLIRSFANAGRTTSTGIDLSAEWGIAKWWRFFLAGNVYDFYISGDVDGLTVSRRSLNAALSANTTFTLARDLKLQWDASYVSRTITSQGEDTDLFLSGIALRYTFWEDRLTVGAQMQNIFNTNIQTLTIEGPGAYSSTEYTKYDRALLLSAGYRLNDKAKKGKAQKTEYGEKDF